MIDSYDLSLRQNKTTEESSSARRSGACHATRKHQATLQYSSWIRHSGGMYVNDRNPDINSLLPFLVFSEQKMEARLWNRCACGWSS